MIASTVGAQHHGATSSLHKDIKLTLTHHIKVLSYFALSNKQPRVKEFSSFEIAKTQVQILKRPVKHKESKAP